MVMTEKRVARAQKTTIATDEALTVLEHLLMTRLADEKMNNLSKQNKGGTFYLSSAGHELIGIASAQVLEKGVDWCSAYYRDHALPVALGCCVSELFACFLARHTKNHGDGRLMPFHYSHRELRMLPHSSPVGSQFLQAAGKAYAIKYSGEKEVMLVSGGDGSTSQGDFYEALNFASIHKLPLIFVIHNNQWAISVPLEEQTAGKSILPMAKGYAGLATHEVDGTDYLSSKEALQMAVDKAKLGNGPSLIVANVPRIAAHSSSDNQKKYRDEEDLANDKKRDPVIVFKQFLIENEILTKKDIELVQQTVVKKIDEAVIFAEKQPHPDTTTVTDFVFKTTDEAPSSQVVKEGNEIVIMDAINHALAEEMERDPNLMTFGQDVAHGKGGVFGITRNLSVQFGNDRCFNTPLAESTILGLALGISCDGTHKAVAEIQFADYMWTGANQLLNETAGFQWRSNGEWDASLVVRLPYGGYIQGGPYHSQSIEAYLTHTPGLKVVVPSNAKDAKGLMKSAIRDPNPVMFLEHKALYRQKIFCARKEPSEDYLVPIGKASLIRQGDDVTVVAWGMMLVMAHDVCDKLTSEGIEVDLIDLRTLMPWDKESILQSLKKTGKLMVIHEAPMTGGLAAEIATTIMEAAFDDLDAPIKRVCGLNTPVPYSKILETAVLPQKEDIEKGIRDLYQY